MLASDDANPAFVGAKDPDAALVVEFFIHPVQNNFQSSKQGRPIFDDVIYVKINVPGLKEMEWIMPARSDHQARFPRQWAHFKNKTEGDAREVGTPLKEWPMLTRSQAEEFRGIKFFTVESIANASDANINNLGMIGGMSPYALREKARAFLQSAKDTALPQHQAEELAKRDAEISMLKEQFAQLAASIKAPPQANSLPSSSLATPEPPRGTATPAAAAPKKRGPGRPSKAELAARKAQQEATGP